MRRLRSAFGAHTLTARSAGRRSTHTSASATSAPASASAGAFPKTSWHHVSPLSHSPMLTPAPWHQECRGRQSAIQKSGEDVLDCAADESDHLHAGRGQSRFQRGRNCPANEHIHAEARHLGRPAQGIRSGQPYFLAPQSPSVLDFHQQQAAGDVEDGRYATVPLRNRDLHHHSQMHGQFQIATYGKQTCSSRRFVQSASRTPAENCRLHGCGSQFQPFTGWHRACSELPSRNKEHS